MNRYLGDLRVGETWSSRFYHVTAEAIIQFATEFDPQPMHMDPVAALEGPFEGLVASGWHVAAIAMRLSVELKCFGGTPVIGAGVDELRWRRPVRSGDTLHLVRTVQSVEDPAGESRHGLIRSNVEVFNQEGKLVMTFVALARLPR